MTETTLDKPYTPLYEAQLDYLTRIFNAVPRDTKKAIIADLEDICELYTFGEKE